MARWRQHRERAEEARVLFPLEGREITIDVAAIEAAERATTAAYRAAAIKAKGVFTTRRSSFFFVYTVVLESPPHYDENGFDLGGGPRGVVAEVSPMLFIRESSRKLVAGVIRGSLKRAFISPTHKRTEGRAPVWGSEFTSKRRRTTGGDPAETAVG
jgi:hypothetical protein